MSLEDLLGVTFLEEQAKVVASSAGLPEDQTKFVFCLLVAYPLAYLFSKLPNNPALKHVVSMFFGVYFGWFIMKWQILHSFVSSAVVYLLAVVLPRETQHKVAFAWIMLYMSVSHIYRMYTDYMGWTMDFTGPQMVLTIKLITFAFDYRDGVLDEKDMKPYQKIMHLKTLPNPLEFFGYVYFFCGFLAGPAVNMREYLSFVDGSLFKDTPNKKMPSAVVPSLIKFGQTLIILIGVFLQMQYPLVYCRTDEFVEHALIYKLAYIWFAAVLQRFPYYFAWYFSEGSCIMAGIGYSGMVNGKPTWNRATNVKAVNLELGQSFKDVTEAWNIRTDKWLKHYIYERVSSNAVALTFLMSALWHGFYPGYYFSFFTAGFVVTFARTMRRNFRSRFLEADEKTPKPSKKLYDLASFIATTFTLNYCMTPFILLGGEYSWRAWSSVYFLGHVFILLTYGLALVVGPPRKKKPEEKKAQ